MMVVLCESRQGLSRHIRGKCLLLVGIFSFLVASSALGNEFTEPKRINKPFIGNEKMFAFEFLGDSNRAIYDVTDISSGFRKLYNAQLSGAPDTVDNLTGSRHLRLVDTSPNGEFIVYGTANNSFSSTSSLTSQRSDMSSGPVALSPQLGGGREIASLRVSPDGQTVVFTSEETINNLRELYSVPISGPSSERIKLSGPMDPPVGSTITGVNIVAISPDSSRVLYMAKQTGDAKHELYSVAIDGSSAPVRLTDLGSDRTVHTDRIHISPDSSVITFVSNQDIATHYELYRVSITGPSNAAIKLNHASDGESVIDSLISPDGNTVVYRAARSDFDGLYSVPLDRSSEPLLINPIPVADGDVESRFRISADSSHVVFSGDLDTNNIRELYSVPITGPSTATVKLHSDLGTNQSVDYGFELTPDGNGVVFRMDTSLPNYQFDLYHSPIDGSSAARMLNLNAHDDVDLQSTFHISPNSEFVVYIADQDTDEVMEIYLASLNKAQDPVKLNAPLPEGGDVGGTFLPSNNYLSIAPNSVRILYGAEQVTDGDTELFLVEQKTEQESCFVIKTTSNRVATFCL